MFLLENTFCSNDDLRLNAYTFTWLDKIQPIFDTAQIKLMNEKEIWTSKCKEKRSKLLLRLSEIYSRVDDLKHREKISDAEAIVQFLKNLSQEMGDISMEVKNELMSHKILNY